MFPHYWLFFFLLELFDKLIILYLTIKSNKYKNIFPYLQLFDFYDKIYVKVKHKKGGEKDLERNVLIDNKEVAFVANHFINENRVPVTMKDLYDQKNQKTDYSRVINIMVVFCPKCKQMHPIFRTYQKDGEFVYCKDDKEYDADFFLN